MSEVRTRFAPSPTGYMHIGNLRTAIYEYLVARTNGGKFILRIEDTDQKRLVNGAVEVIYNTLKTVGLDYDEGPDVGGSYGPYVQSERKQIYAEYAQKLVQAGSAYFCFCSQERLDSIKGDYGYDGLCNTLSQEEIEKKLADNCPYVIRQKIPKAGQVCFSDHVYGTITVDCKTLDEGILLKSDGLPTYNFANVIDDHLMGITHVVRGSEYLSSTPKYNLIYQAFGWDVPEYIHLPPIMKVSGKKLSKREGDASFDDYVLKGYLPEALVNYIVLLGWNPGTDEEFFTLDELKDRFTIEGLSKSPAIFDVQKLRWMNGAYIRKMPIEKFHELASRYYTEIQHKGYNLFKLSNVLQPRTEVLSDIPQTIDFLVDLPNYDPALFINEKSKINLSIASDCLKALEQELCAIKEWENGIIFKTLEELATRLGVKKGQLLWPLRIALCGKEISPGGGSELAEILGKEESLRRISAGITKLAVH